MLRIGLTGGIGSGKSTVAAMFAQRGVPVIDTDEIARELSAPDQPGYRQIVNTFGSEILNDAGAIDRHRLRAQVFADPETRRRLETILHPLIREEVKQRIEKLRTDYCVIAVPLLIETEFDNLVDRILVVDAKETDQIRRVAARNNMTEAEIRAIMAAQADRETRRRRAHDIVSNCADLTRLEAEVDRLHARYRLLAKHWAH